MSLITREPSPAQSAASRANSQHSTGPRSERGKALSRHNALKPRPFSALVARTLRMLGERPRDFEQMHKALSAAMGPRDAWEAAWIQDLAILRWRLARLQRAEVGVLAKRKRELAHQRRRAGMPSSGEGDPLQRMQIASAGFISLPDSPWKFQQVIRYLQGLRALVFTGDFDEDNGLYFDILYGKAPGAQGAALRARYEALAKLAAEGEFHHGCPAQVSLTESLDAEISTFQQLQARYATEDAENDLAQADADLLLPPEAMETVIRLETHLEDQIERKLKQFYARRREPVLRVTADDSEELLEPSAGQQLAASGG